eukprot:TRINITY_DN23_c0_g1_i1.p1 TRINITY_DN23_c0_g1~~TRINITY_DN23_c0_g1_i1.p1  ORF type:complete len:391 (+),score=138.06 TRINITY_DN23_c0_g1_i1:72-1175(+)
MKAKKYDIAETNLANFGTELEKNIKLAAAQGEKAWAETGKSEGLLIWRIEKFKVIKSKTPVGSFYENDSYIVLHTIKNKKGEFAYDVHFWLGKSTTQDEAGTAAYKTVELDDYLLGKPIQHREVQDYESPLFIGYFEKFGGIKILKGGIETGFKAVDPKSYQPRLMWVKGKKNVRVREVKKSFESMNNGDVFILDMGLKIYQWNGSKCGVFEKSKAGQLCRALDSERSGKPVVIVVEQGSEDQEFWNALGDKGTIKDESNVPKDDEWETSTEKKLWKFSDESGKFEFELISEGSNVKRDQLKEEDVFIFDAGNHIYAWVGEKASSGERKYAMHYAQQYTRTYQRPSVLPITMVPSGRESPQFKNAFN